MNVVETESVGFVNAYRRVNGESVIQPFFVDPAAGAAVVFAVPIGKIGDALKVFTNGSMARMRSACRYVARPPAEPPNNSTSVAAPSPWCAIRSFTSASSTKRPRKKRGCPSLPATLPSTFPEKDAPSQYHSSARFPGPK